MLSLPRIHLTNSVLFLALLFIVNISRSQGSFQKFFIPSDTFNSKRAWLAGSAAFGTYAIFSVGLYNAWYKKSEQSSFHLFNDAGEWNHLDKVSHAYNGYVQSNAIYNGAKWCGYSEHASVIWGTSISMLFQTTVEVMDGFSSDWGFSWTDMASNVLGAGLFAGQQLLWHDQKFKLKLSAYPKNYPDGFITGQNGNTITYKQRAEDLYGKEFFTTFLKDYNAQTFWLSFNPGIFSESIHDFWPKYLNISLGYGADNLYGGYKNEWADGETHYSILDYPRTNQYYLSLDIDLTKIKVKNNFLRTALHLINVIKIPAPALEYNSQGKLKWHWLFF